MVFRGGVDEVWTLLPHGFAGAGDGAVSTVGWTRFEERAKNSTVASGDLQYKLLNPDAVYPTQINRVAAKSFPSFKPIHPPKVALECKKSPQFLEPPLLHLTASEHLNFWFIPPPHGGKALVFCVFAFCAFCVLRFAFCVLGALPYNIRTIEIQLPQ